MHSWGDKKAPSIAVGWVVGTISCGIIRSVISEPSAGVLTTAIHQTRVRDGIFGLWSGAAAPALPAKAEKP